MLCPPRSVQHNPHPYNTQHQQTHRHRQRHRHFQRPGSSPSYPIVIPPSSSDDNNHLWHAPDPSAALESFAWPSMWFDVPSVSPPASGQYTAQCNFDMLDALPDLIHCDVKTPDVSPVSMRDACTTPAGDSANVVAICDVPLVAPRPLPFTPPAFLQFDCLPDEDEDLSFPPYTHSRRHSCDTQEQKMNPRKRPALPLTSTITSEIETEADAITSLPSISKKRRRVMHSENTAPALVPAARPAVFVDSGQPFLQPQLVQFTRDGMMGWI